MSGVSYRAEVEAWFRGLDEGQLDALIKLFDNSPTIRNAANPPLTGSDAPRKLLEDFFRRTQSRHFRLLGMAQNEDLVFAWWEGTLEFRDGIRIADIEIRSPFSVTFRGADVFEFNRSNRRIRNLEIHHETTTVAKSARAHAGAGP